MTLLYDMVRTLARVREIRRSAGVLQRNSDEIEKAFGNSSGERDGGVSSRLFGSFLTWLNEKTSPVFVVATANRVDVLPAELTRKGRLSGKIRPTINCSNCWNTLKSTVLQRGS